MNEIKSRMALKAANAGMRRNRYQALSVNVEEVCTIQFNTSTSKEYLFVLRFVSSKL